MKLMKMYIFIELLRYHTYVVLYLATEHPLELSSLACSFQSSFDSSAFYYAELNLMLLKLTQWHTLKVFSSLPFQWLGFSNSTSLFFRNENGLNIHFTWKFSNWIDETAEKINIKKLKNIYTWNKQRNKHQHISSISQYFKLSQHSAEAVIQKCNAVKHTPEFFCKIYFFRCCFLQFFINLFFFFVISHRKQQQIIQWLAKSWLTEQTVLINPSITCIDATYHFRFGTLSMIFQWNNSNIVGIFFYQIFSFPLHIFVDFYLQYTTDIRIFLLYSLIHRGYSQWFHNYLT